MRPKLPPSSKAFRELNREGATTMSIVTETGTAVTDIPVRPGLWTRIGRWAAILLVVGLLALLGWGMVQAANGPRDSGLAPDFSLTAFDGRAVTLSQLRGQVVIINFWASWCPPCREEAAYLESTWRKYKDQGVIFIGVDYVDAEPSALAYIDEFDITY